MYGQSVLEKMAGGINVRSAMRVHDNRGQIISRLVRTDVRFNSPLKWRVARIHRRSFVQGS